MNNLILNSKISKKVNMYNNIRCVDSVIGEKCTVADECDIVRTIMHKKSEFGRRNIIRDVEIGEGTYTGTNTVIKSTVIGKYSCIGWNVSIGGGNHDYTKISMYTDYWFNRTFGIKTDNKVQNLQTWIGNDVWIAAGVNIINGVTIGNGCVIGAGAVVVNDLPDYSIAIGIPARVVKYRFDEDVIKALLELKWWDWSEEKIIKNIDFIKSIPSVEDIMELLS